MPQSFDPNGYTPDPLTEYGPFGALAAGLVAVVTLARSPPARALWRWLATLPELPPPGPAGDPVAPPGPPAPAVALPVAPTAEAGDPALAGRWALVEAGVRGVTEIQQQHTVSLATLAQRVEALEQERTTHQQERMALQQNIQTLGNTIARLEGALDNARNSVLAELYHPAPRRR
jgi:hypothetical protein